MTILFKHVLMSENFDFIAQKLFEELELYCLFFPKQETVYICDNLTAQELIGVHSEIMAD